MKILTPDQYPGLPKWPMAYVTGESVTPEQAKEINFRTDTNFHSISEYGFGNDRDLRKRCTKLFGWEPIIAAQEAMFKRDKDAPYTGLSGWEMSSRWVKEMGIITTEYVCNSFLATSYIGGPHGWCQLDGTIRSEGTNYGKWPSVEEVVNEWGRLQEAFPFLNLVCTLYSGEQCEDDSVPVVSIIVQNGAILVVEPDMSLHNHEQPNRGSMDDMLTHVMALSHGDYSAEQGWPEAWIVEFGERSRAAVAKVIVNMTREAAEEAMNPTEDE
jgi:hypothetical protein